MRILGFSKRWQKLSNPEFTTFRFSRRDKDWYASEVVQIVYKPRTKEREILGVAHIISKEYRKVKEITTDEATRDGFVNFYAMWLFLKKPNVNDLIHKLTLRWEKK